MSLEIPCAETSHVALGQVCVFLRKGFACEVACRGHDTCQSLEGLCGLLCSVPEGWCCSMIQIVNPNDGDELIAPQHPKVKLFS